MSITDAFSIAASGLAAATVQLNVTAGNIANADTPGYQARRVDLVELSGGGVQVAGTTVDTTPGPVDENGDAGSNVDIAKEAIDLKRAKTTYAANAAVVRATDEMLGTLLDVVSGDDDRRPSRHARHR